MKNIAQDIISDGKSQPHPPASPKAPKTPSLTSSVHSIDIEPADNGLTVSHMPVDTKHGGGDYSKRQKNVFTDHKAAHAHIGKLLGCSGE